MQDRDAHVEEQLGCERSDVQFDLRCGDRFGVPRESDVQVGTVDMENGTLSVPERVSVVRFMRMEVICALNFSANGLTR